MAFRDDVAAQLEDDIDREFMERGRAIGLDPMSMHEIQEVTNGQNEANGAENSPSPFANLSKRDQRSAARMRSIGQYRPTPKPEPPKQEKPKARRKQLVVNYEDTPVDLIDERTGDTITVYMRSIPTTELPFLDRHDMMLQRLRQRLAGLTGRDTKTARQVERLAQEYNELSEEMTRFVVEMPDGLYERLNVPTLRALQREIQRMVTGTEVEVPAGDEEDDDPNW